MNRLEQEQKDEIILNGLFGWVQREKNRICVKNVEKRRDVLWGMRSYCGHLF